MEHTHHAAPSTRTIVSRGSYHNALLTVSQTETSVTCSLVPRPLSEKGSGHETKLECGCDPSSHMHVDDVGGGAFDVRTCVVILHADSRRGPLFTVDRSGPRGTATEQTH